MKKKLTDVGLPDVPLWVGLLRLGDFVPLTVQPGGNFTRVGGIFIKV